MKNAVVPLLVSALVLWIVGGSVWYSKTFCGSNPNAIPGFEVIDGSFSYSAASTFYFNPNSAEPQIPSETDRALKQIAEHLKRNPYRQLTLSGIYNISEKSQTKSENLGIARANAIKKKLIHHGAMRENIKIEGIKTNNGQGGSRKLFGGVLFSFFEDPNSKTAVEIEGAVVPVASKADLIASSITTPPKVEKEVVKEEVKPKTESIISEPEKIAEINDADEDVELVTIGRVQNEESYKMRPLNLYFPSNKYKLKLVPELEIYFNDLKAFLKANPKTKIYLTGHSDSMGDNPKYNMRLSKLRARAVKVFMEENGFPANLIIIDYKGPDEPLADNETEEGRTKNRRVEVRIHD